MKYLKKDEENKVLNIFGILILAMFLFGLIAGGVILYSNDKGIRIKNPEKINYQAPHVSK